MKYQPRKVFILENGVYQEHTYQELCQKRENDGSFAKRHFIPLQGMLLEVSQEIYAEFYREKERDRYLRKLDRENGLFSIDSLEKPDDNGMEYFKDSVDVTAEVINKIQLDKLRECISLLSSEEQRLIYQHYYDEISETNLSREYGISQQAVSKRLKRIRKKLRNLMES